MSFWEMAMDTNVRTITMDGDINAALVDRILREMESTPKGSKILIDIRSTGGLTGDAERLAQMCLERQCDTVARGILGSAAILVFLAGTERSVGKDVKIMFHKGRIDIPAGKFSAAALQEKLDALKAVDMAFAHKVSERTRVISALEALSFMEQEAVLNGPLAVRYGLADKIV